MYENEEKDRSEEERGKKEEGSEPKAICWIDGNNSVSDNIPKVNVHKIVNYEIKNLCAEGNKIASTEEYDYRSIDRDPIFEVHTVSKDGKTTDYSYIKLNVTEFDPKFPDCPYTRKNYSIRFTHKNTIKRDSLFKRFRKYDPRFISAKSKRSNLGISRAISYDMLKRVLWAIKNFAENVESYCEYNNNHEDFIYDVSQKAGIPGYTSTFSSFFGLSRHNLYKRQLKHMADEDSDFDYFSEAGSPSKKYEDDRKKIYDISTESGLDYNVFVTADQFWKLFKSLLGSEGSKLGDIDGSVLLTNMEWQKIDEINTLLEKNYINRFLKKKGSYDKALMLKSLQRNLILPAFELKREGIMKRKNLFRFTEYITKEVTSDAKYISDEEFPEKFEDQNIHINFQDASDDKLFPNDEPEIGDIRQTIIGDCYLVADLISIVSTDKGKEFIKKVVVDNGDGTVTVTFFGEGKKIKVQKTIPIGLSESALWVQMIEKAYAALDKPGNMDGTNETNSRKNGERSKSNENNNKKGYDSIVGGDAANFMGKISNKEDVNGINKEPIDPKLWSEYKLSKLTQTENYTLSQLDVWKQVQEGLKMNKNILFSSNRNSIGIRAKHQYAIIGCEKIGSHYFFKIVNPWNNRFGLAYNDIENMRSKEAIEGRLVSGDSFYLELSHCVDLVEDLYIV